MPWDETFWIETINQIQSNLSQWLPAIVGAMLLLLIGWLVARISQALIGRILRKLGLDSLAERTGITKGLNTIGTHSNLSYILARSAYWLIQCRRERRSVPDSTISWWMNTRIRTSSRPRLYDCWHITTTT